MSENTTPATGSTEEVKAPTAEELAEMFKALPGEFQTTLTDLNKLIAEHNAKVDSIKSSEAKDPKLIKAEIFEQNPSDNKKLSILRDKELKLQEQIEAIRKQAYEIIDTDGLMPQELNEEQLEKLKTEVTESTKELRERSNALLKFEEMMPMFAGKITPHIAEIKTRRGAAKTGTSSGAKGDGPKRLRFKKIEINGVTDDGKGNTVYQLVDGEPKYTFTFASQYLKKQHKGIKWAPKDLTDTFLEGKDEDNLPEVSEFVMPHVFKDEKGNEHTVNYTVKCYR